MEDGGELRFLGLGQHRNEVWTEIGCIMKQHIFDIQAKESGRVALAELAEEGPVGGVVVPARADEGGGEADTEEDLAEEVVVVEHLGHDGCGRCRQGLEIHFHPIYF